MAMNNYFRPTPIFFTALGASFGFYFFSSLAVILILAPLVIIFLCAFYSVYINFSKTDMRFLLERKSRLAVICAIAFCIGLITGFYASRAGRQNTYFGFLPERVTAIEGALTEDPRLLSSGSAMARVSLIRCASETPNGLARATASGEITVFFPEASAEKLREFGRGTTVYSEGSLRAASSGAASSGAASGGANSFDEGFTFSAKTMFVVKPAPRMERARTGLRLKLIERARGKEWGGLAIALLLGIKDNLDSDLSASYRKAGSSYILALSGMHLSVLAAIIAFFLRKPLGLKPAAVAGAAIIILYCLLVGPMPSLYRAALMYLLGTVAILGFLPRRPLEILSLSFLIQIIATPAAGHSISFILSYLALFGIFVIGQPLYEIFAGKVPDFLMQPLSASCGAFLATAGVTGAAFGYVAPVGIIAGLVLVPLTTLYMMLSLLWLVLGDIMGAPLSILYRLMESIVGAASGAPAIITRQSAIIIVSSIVISILIILYEYRQRKSRLSLMSF